MRKAVLRLLGGTAFWLSWPYLYWHLSRSTRSRVLVKAAGKVLMIRTWHGSGGWSLPGGGIKSGEDPLLSATRELKEETGVALGTDQLQFLGQHRVRLRGLPFNCRFYAAELAQTVQVRSRPPEVIEVRWINEHELGDYPLAADARPALSSKSLLQ